MPPQGQTWTSLKQLVKDHKNEWHQLVGTNNCWSIRSEPQVAIGQRCILITTPAGNVLWDCITLLDAETTSKIKEVGGLKAIVISHPHYYSSHMHWADTFECPVFIAAEDEEWCVAEDRSHRRKLLQHESHEISDNVTALKLGGHFPGSLVLHYLPDPTQPAQSALLFIADTIVTVPSALYHVDRLPGTTSYSFDWSIPNRIPLPPPEIFKMWQVLKKWKFGGTFGAFLGMDIWDERIKFRVLESMKIQCRAMGYGDDQADIFSEQSD